MKKMKRIVLLTLLTTCFGNAFSQNLQTIDSLQKSCQSCLDEGRYMYGCTAKYYEQSDSLLNVVYNRLRAKLTFEEKEELKNEQLAWLKKRDQYFKNEFQKLKSEGDWEEGTVNFDMILQKINGDFVMEQVTYLMKKTEFKSQ